MHTNFIVIIQGYLILYQSQGVNNSSMIRYGRAKEICYALQAPVALMVQIMAHYCPNGYHIAFP
jgi:hypothetical protein